MRDSYSALSLALTQAAATLEAGDRAHKTASIGPPDYYADRAVALHRACQAAMRGEEVRNCGACGWCGDIHGAFCPNCGGKL